MLTISTYQTTAYCSDKIPTQSAVPAGYPKGMGATIYKTASRLPWGNTGQATLLSPRHLRGKKTHYSPKQWLLQ